MSAYHSMRHAGSTISGGRTPESHGLDCACIGAPLSAYELVGPITWMVDDIWGMAALTPLREESWPWILKKLPRSATRNPSGIPRELYRVNRVMNGFESLEKNTNKKDDTSR